jgi:hypothetical protein
MKNIAYSKKNVNLGLNSYNYFNAVALNNDRICIIFFYFCKRSFYYI